MLLQRNKTVQFCLRTILKHYCFCVSDQSNNFCKPTRTLIKMAEQRDTRGRQTSLRFKFLPTVLATWRTDQIPNRIDTAETQHQLQKCS